MPKSSVGTVTVRLRENTAALCGSVRETLAGGRGQSKNIGLEWPQLGGWVSQCWVPQRGGGQEQGPCTPSKAVLI